MRMITKARDVAEQSYTDTAWETKDWRADALTVLLHSAALAV